jgi:dihydrofolate reductase
MGRESQTVRIMISMVATVSEYSGKWIIGDRRMGPPPWSWRFSWLRKGNTVIMGRRTFQGLKCRKLEGQINCVLSRKSMRGNSSTVGYYGDLDSALEDQKELRRNVYIIGGAEVFRASLDRCDEVVVYKIDWDLKELVESGKAVFFPREELELENKSRWIPLTHTSNVAGVQQSIWKRKHQD